MKTPDWERFEEHVQRVLKLSRTIASGSRHYDPGDAVNKKHYEDEEFRFIADAKCTSARVFTLQDKMLRQWVERARKDGKRFCLPLRFQTEMEDYVVLSLDDFAEMLVAANEKTETEKLDFSEEIRVLNELVLHSSLSSKEKLDLLNLATELEHL